MLILRSVCRHFRAITSHLDFWYDPYFLFRYLIAYKIDPAREERLLNVRLSDKNLVEALGRRKASWSFQSLDGLKAVIREFPLFKQSVQAVHLEFVIHNIATAIELLSECPHITTFTTVLASSLNLTDIASSWPLLKELSCSETGHFSGSLENLAHLKVLCIKMWSNTSASNLRTSRPWLPLASAETLTELTLYPDRQVDPSFFDVRSLSTFHNLVSLTIGPLSLELCTYLVTSQCRLEIFGTQLLRHHTPIDMVSVSSNRQTVLLK